MLVIVSAVFKQKQRLFLNSYINFIAQLYQNSHILRCNACVFSVFWPFLNLS
nr:MAG TPA: hypothetical protein [Caudoviricetes sp.]